MTAIEFTTSYGLAPGMAKPAKQPGPIDLSEYAEEAMPFDAVIRKLASVKSTHSASTKQKPARVARERK